MSVIKHIIFDLGNVIIDLDIPRTQRLFEQRIGANYQKFKAKLDELDWWNRYEKGLISSEEFITGIQQAVDFDWSANSIKYCWNGMLLGIPPERLKMLQDIAAHYDIYLLSNTNEIHVNWVGTYLKAHYKISITDFNCLFEQPYYSHLINKRKPDADIYEFVLEDTGLIAEETLFIDDNKANIESANAIGIVGHWHPLGSEVTDLFEDGQLVTYA